QSKSGLLVVFCQFHYCIVFVVVEKPVFRATRSKHFGLKLLYPQRDEKFIVEWEEWRVSGTGRDIDRRRKKRFNKSGYYQPVSELGLCWLLSVPASEQVR
ncbi:hypothetical protein VSU19_00005, partial [Verrucomicrobiales bacterium BCK34]|nr:hypothetical protein [Verrucomicrobiales bacterium BCK34]